MNDLHMSRLVEWVVRRIGLALLWSLIAGTICGVIAGVEREVGWLYIGGFVCPLVFAFTLVAANAPLPDPEDSEVE